MICKQNDFIIVSSHFKKSYGLSINLSGIMFRKDNLTSVNRINTLIQIL